MKNTKEIDEYLANLTSAFIPNSVCKARTIYCLNWYSRRATLNKVLYYILSIINITVPLLSSIIIIVFKDQNLIVAALTALASFCASLLSLLGAKDKWTNYRTAAEFIKAHYALYLSQSAPYNGPDNHSLYLNTIETYMQNIHSHWIDTQNNSTSGELANGN